MGTGAMMKYEESKSSWNSWDQFLTINLKMKTSDAFKDGELDADAMDGIDDDD
jgi:hypothetical protein